MSTITVGYFNLSFCHGLNFELASENCSDLILQRWFDGFCLDKEVACRVFGTRCELAENIKVVNIVYKLIHEKMEQMSCTNNNAVNYSQKTLCWKSVIPRSRNTYLVAYSDFPIVFFFDLFPVFVLLYEFLIWLFCLGFGFVDSELVPVRTRNSIIVYDSIWSFRWLDLIDFSFKYHFPLLYIFYDFLDFSGIFRN